MSKLVFSLLSLLLSAAMLTSAVAEESVFTSEMVERSLYSVGNTQRLHRTIEKAQAGEKVSIVYLGGSITEGASAVPQQTNCYAYRSAQLFAEKFMKDASQLEYHNAGISGTPSLLGITRCQQDVLDYKPDIVFVEFAVNDSTDDTSRMVYESLVRKLLQSETQPAVVLVITLMNSGYSAHVHMKQVGKHYDLGVVSVYDAVQIQINQGKMQWSDYSADYAHPTTEGHAFVAELIGYYFDQAAATPAEEYTLPEEAHYGKTLENLQNIRPGDAAIVSEGGFPFGDVTCYSYTKGWRHPQSAASADSMVLQVNGSYLSLAFKQEKNTACGTAEVLVDGTVAAALPGYADSAWGNVVTQLIPLGDSGEHRIELRMTQGDEAKRFNLLDIAFAP